VNPTITPPILAVSPIQVSALSWLLITGFLYIVIDLDSYTKDDISTLTSRKALILDDAGCTILEHFSQNRMPSSMFLQRISTKLSH
jgi:hypothetical protein